MSDDFVETKLLEIVEPTDEDYLDLGAYECYGCGRGMASPTETQPLFVWGEPTGDVITVKVYHSRNCALRDINAWTRRINRDVMVVHRVR